MEAQDAIWPNQIPALPPLTSEHSFVNVKGASLSISLDEVTNISVDPRGRPIGAFAGGVNYRCCLDGRVQAKQAFRAGQWTARQRRWLDEEQARGFYEAVHRRATESLRAFHDGRLEHRPAAGRDDLRRTYLILERAAAFTPAHVAEESRRFAEIYGRVPILPPDQYRSLVLQVTRGCPYNRCAFCNFYRDTAYSARDKGGFEAHVEAVRAFFGPGLSLRRSIFLGDANAVLLPADQLVSCMALVRKVFPSLAEPGRTPSSGVFTFADGLTGRSKSVGDFRRLAAAGLRRVYIGLETGHQPLLDMMRKPATVSQTVRSVRTLKQSGINVGIIIMVGLGGRPLAEVHKRDTLSVLHGLPLGDGDIIYLSPLVEHEETPYGAIAAGARLEPLSDAELQAELTDLTLSLRRPGGPKVSLYDIREFIY